MGNLRVDIREVLVAKSLLLFPPPNVRRVMDAVPGREMDAAGIDKLAILNTGVALPIQIKAGLATVGVILPLPDDKTRWPKRLPALISHRMMTRMNRQFRKHPEIKALLFVNMPKGYEEDTLRKILQEVEAGKNYSLPPVVYAAMREIAAEVTHVINIAVEHTFRAFKKPHQSP